MKRLLRSLSFRLALAYAGLFCVSVAILMGLYYWVGVVRSTDAIKTGIDHEARQIAQIYIADGRDAVTSALERRAAIHGKRRAFHAFIAGDGKVVTANLPSWPRKPSADWVVIEADVYEEGDEIDYNALVRDRSFDDGARLLVGRDTEDVDEREELILIAMRWILGGTLPLALAGGFFMARTIGARIDAVNRAALQVMAGDLSGRVPVRGSGDDFDRLGETLNLMLERIESLFDAVRRMSDNAAHELRTPLARLMARLEQVEAAEADPAARQAAQAAAMIEAKRLRRIFDALLRITRIERGGHEPDFREAELAPLVHDAAEFHAPEAERRGIALSVTAQPGLRARIDPDLMFQALANLFDNALKHVPDGGRIDLSAHADGDSVILTLGDNGPGLQPGEEKQVTERFFRGANAVGVPGEGLGLSLVAAIAALHGGFLRFSDNAPGLRVELVFPAA